VYGISRNPQIVGFFVYALGFALLWPSWYALGWVVFFGPFFHWMVITEEEHLLKLHGDAYRRYCEQVPRYMRLRPRQRVAPT
jgi:protein-S-isoprenylcysteine O-methyltransferase Ste14